MAKSKLDTICDSVENLTKRFDARMARRDASRTDALEIGLGGRRYPLSENTDAGRDQAIKAAGLWKPGKDYPAYTIYSNGVKVVRGGGIWTARVMDKA